MNGPCGASAYAIAGAFYLYAYSPDVFQLTPNLNLQIPELAVADCDASTTYLRTDGWGRWPAGCLLSGARLLLTGGLLVHLFGQFMRRLHQVIDGRVDRGGIRTGLHRLHFGDGILDCLLLVGGDFVAEILQRFLGRVDHVIGFVARFDQCLLRLVFVGVRLSVLDHRLDFLLGQAAR